MLLKKVRDKLIRIVKKPKGPGGFVNDLEIEMELLLKFLPEKPFIIDCGAHIGIDSIKLSLIPGSKVFSFEPVESLYETLLTNTEKYTNIYCFKLALSNHHGESDFYVSSGDSDASSSLLKPKEHIIDHPTVKFDSVTKVDCITLDAWAEENSVNQVDMLWLDMQGFEQSMLEVSQSILPGVSVIHSEVSLRETYEGVKNYTAYKQFLQLKGFEVVAEAIPEGYDMGNVLFVKSSLLK